MVSTAHQLDEEKKEYIDEPHILDEKVSKLVEMMKASEFTVAFTGAGISTACGI